MVRIFIGDLTAVNAEDKKWFLAAYGSFIPFYFGAKAIEGRASRRGLSIFGLYPPSGTLPSMGTVPAKITIDGSGFESPIGVTFGDGDRTLPTRGLVAVSESTLEVLVDVSANSQLGGYDVAVELSNGSKIARKSGFTVGTTPSPECPG